MLDGDGCDDDDDDEIYSVNNFIKDTEDCQVCRLYIIMDICYSGKFVEAIANSPMDHKNVAIYSASGKTEVSYGNYTNAWLENIRTAGPGGVRKSMNALHEETAEDMDTGELEWECYSLFPIKVTLPFGIEIEIPAGWTGVPCDPPTGDSDQEAQSNCLNNENQVVECQNKSTSTPQMWDGPEDGFPNGATTLGYCWEFVPTLSEWGLIIFTLLGLSLGMALIRKRQGSIASAGELSLSEEVQLFDQQNYLKALAIVLIFGVVCLIFARCTYGSLPLHDIIGVLLSCGIIAFMIQLTMKRKESENR